MGSNLQRMSFLSCGMTLLVVRTHLPWRVIKIFIRNVSAAAINQEVPQPTVEGHPQSP